MKKNLLKATNGKEKPLSITDENIIDFNNVISNNITSVSHNRQQVFEVMKFENEFLKKVKKIQDQRDNLLKKVKELEKNVSKTDK